MSKEIDFFGDIEFSDNKPKDGLHLVFITKIGEVHDVPIYEFIFSNEPDSACGPQWENICQYNVEPPEDKWVSAVGTLQSEEIVLTLLEELDNFRYLDGVFGAVALGFEFIEDYSTMHDLNAGVLRFMYGDTLEDVQSRLKERNLGLKMS